MSSIKIIGPQKLRGDVTISGSKNAALPILAATILLNGKSILSNVPDLTDILTIIRLLRALGLRAEFLEGNQVVVWGTKDVRHIAPYELITSMRASFFVAGAILARAGLAKIPLPGGCAIGSRPVDIHLSGFKALGASIKMEHGFVILEASELIGADIPLAFPSVGATENLMMAATLAKGTTVIRNAALEPEIDDLANFLNKAGAKISGAGTSTLTIDGVSSLHAVQHSIIPDRVETATFMIGAALTHGKLKIHHIEPNHFTALTVILKKMGVRLSFGDHSVEVDVPNKLKPIIELETAPYPGFPTDMQPQLMALLSTIPGTSVVKETIFENRFMHAAELNRMGANIQTKGNLAIIEGVKQLSGAPVKVTDLRAGAAMWLAAIAADGETNLFETQHVYRGYERFREKLEKLGAVFIDV